MTPKKKDQDYPRPKRYKDRGQVIENFIEGADDSINDQNTIKQNIGKSIKEETEPKEWTGFYLSKDTARKLESLVSNIRNLPGVTKRQASKSRAVEAAILLAVEDFNEREAEARFTQIFIKQ